MKEGIVQPGGLHTDNSLTNQPINATRMVLNGINETGDGDMTFISNEEGNKIHIALKLGYVPIGKCYMSNNEVAIMSVDFVNKISEIGILDGNGVYTTHVNDQFSPVKDKLNFSVFHQIQATFRLRRGCERTIYFTDNFNRPRYYNFDKPSTFYNTNQQWANTKFDLKKAVRVYPVVGSIEVLENQGSLLPGSYTVFFQYLDESLNGTKFIEIATNINIVNDRLTDNYADIQGSTGLNVEHIKYLATNKAIKFTFTDLDLNYTNYRLAFVEYTDGLGKISRVNYTNHVNTITKEIVYTGTNAQSAGTIKDIELSQLDSTMERVGSIEQIDNKLILANVQGHQYNFCGLQKFASKIKADVIVKDILLTSVEDNHNSKNPLVHMNGLSHQPGDIYSYGLIYIFDDLTESPVLHIPGKNNNLSNNHVFSPGPNVKALKSSDNKNLSEFYINKNLCGTDDYWGVDSEGQRLTNTQIRHHRFPTREELGIGFVQEVESFNSTDYKQLNIILDGLIKKTVLCNPVSNTSCPEYYIAPKFRLILRYKLNGVNQEFTTPLITEHTSLSFFSTTVFLSSDTLTDIELFYIVDGTTTEINIPLNTNFESVIQSNNLKYKITNSEIKDDSGIPKLKVPILGIKFSNITIPTEEEANGKIIGYKIVRQERTDSDKTILDSAVILPTMHANIGQGSFIAASMNAPVANYTARFSNRSVYYPYDTANTVINILSPQHKFLDKTHDGFTTIEEVGKFKPIENDFRFGGHSIQDVYPGSSADGVPDISDNTRDNDGYTLKQITKAVKVKYEPSNNNKFFVNNVDTNLYNLQPLATAIHSDESTMLYNLSCDNKQLLLSKKTNIGTSNTYNVDERKYPYVYIKKQNNFAYSNFESKPYYNYDNHIYTESIYEGYTGDTHICPLRHSNHTFNNALAATRRSEQSIWDWVIAALLVIVAIVIAVFTWGTGTPASAALVMTAIGVIAVATGSVVMAVAGYVEVANFADVYNDKWEKGLKYTLFDTWVQQVFYEPDLFKIKQQLPYRDDTLRWYGEVLGDFWFESQLNLSLRVPPASKDVNYLKPLKKFAPTRIDKFQILIGVDYNDEYLDGDDYWHYRDPYVGFDGVEETYFAKKILLWKDDKWNYLGVSVPVIYMINNDHNIGKSVTKYYALPEEYDCCSECHEKFPHRWMWSEASYQEELSDNYRVFLPNNYKDITGETGEITNVFKINNDLFLHTSEALYQIPRNYQERVTDQIISFVGTGSYGEIPERKMIDDDTGNSAGSNHKWATIKTPEGVFFVSENQKRIYLFNGQNIIPISEKGLSNWFEENIPLFHDINNNNPSNNLGAGFISAYDTQKERVIFTKKDYTLNDGQRLDNSWTISYSLKSKSWISWHSYLPNFYINIPGKFFSWIQGNSNIWEHNIKGKYHNFYDKKYPFIIEYVDVNEPLTTKIWDAITLQTEAKIWSNENKDYTPIEDITFNQLIAYNTNQITGLLNLKTKDVELDYLPNQIENEQGDVFINKNEKDWTLNELRDIRVNYDKPLFKKSLKDLQNDYFIDKVLNTEAIDYNKDWMQMESMRDKFLVVRLIFNKFDNVKLIMNFAIMDSKVSEH